MYPLIDSGGEPATRPKKSSFVFYGRKGHRGLEANDNNVQ